MSSTSIDLQEDASTAECSSQQDLSNDDEYQPQKVRGSNNDNITLSLPRKGVMHQLSPLGYRLKLSNRQPTSILAGLIKIRGEKLADTTLSVSSKYPHRREGVEETSKLLKERFYIQHATPHCFALGL